MSQMIEERDWKHAWIKRTIERMDELDSRGEKEVTLCIREFQHILMELLAMHQRSDRLEEVLCSYAKYVFPVVQRIEPPTVFGGIGSMHVEGTIGGRWNSTEPNFTEQEKDFGKIEPFTEHVFSRVRSDHRVCVRCNLSDVYVKAFEVETCKP